MDWKTRLRGFAEVAARLEPTAGARRSRSAAAVPPLLPGRITTPADWRLLTSARQRSEAREYERRLRKRCHAVEQQRRRDANECARREEKRILRELAEQSRRAIARARAQAQQARREAITPEFVARLHALTANRPTSPPARTAAQRREDRRWVQAYCAALRFEPRPRSIDR